MHLFKVCNTILKVHSWACTTFMLSKLRTFSWPQKEFPMHVSNPAFPRQCLTDFLSLLTWLLWILHINGLLGYMPFVSDFSLSVMCSRFLLEICYSVDHDALFLFKADSQLFLEAFNSIRYETLLPSLSPIIRFYSDKYYIITKLLCHGLVFLGGTWSTMCRKQKKKLSIICCF